MYYKPYIHRLTFLPYPVEKVRLLLLQFIICNILVVLLGLITVIAVSFGFSDEHLVDYSSVILDINRNCQYLVQFSAAVAIFTGLISLLAHLLGYPGRLLFSLSYLLLCPVGLLSIGIGENSASSIRNTEIYNKMIVLDTQYFLHSDKYVSLSGENTQLSKFQQQHKCCGIFSSKDWLLSRCNCIPTSCCSSMSTPDKCEDIFLTKNLYTKLGLTSTEFQSVIWKRDCIHDIQKILGRTKKKWLAIICLLTPLYCILVMWRFHVTIILKDLVVQQGGFIQLQIFKAHWPTNTIKVKREYHKFVRMQYVVSSDTESEGDKKSVSGKRSQVKSARSASKDGAGPQMKSLSVGQLNKKMRNVSSDPDEILWAKGTEQFKGRSKPYQLSPNSLSNLEIK